MRRPQSPETSSSPSPASLGPSPDPLTAFDTNAEAWDKYTETPLGRLRQDLTLRYLLQHLGPLGCPLNILDVGAGTGSHALPLAQRGHSVCLLDFSAAMLDLARQRARHFAPAVAERIEFRCAHAGTVSDLFPVAHFDVILCHTLLEYVSDPWQTLNALVTVLHPEGLISLVTVNSFADPLRWAIVKGDLQKARAALEEQVSPADLFGLPRRIFPATELAKALGGAGIQTVASHGVRIFADYLPAEKLADPAFYARLLELETAASQHDPYRAIARYTQLLGKSQTVDQ